MTTQQINENIIAQLQLSFNQTIPLMPKSFLRVLAKVLAGVFVILYKYIGFNSLQMFVSSASFRETVVNGKTLVPLIEWGRLIGIGDPVAATRAELLVEITVENQTGTLPAGAQLTNSGNGVTYLTVSATLLDAPTKQIILSASSDQQGGGGRGTIGNLEAGAVLSFANPLPNVARNAVVISQSVTGADRESEASYRQRVIDRFQKTPQGGALVDYEGWGEEVAGIVNIYPYRSDFPGQVDIYVEATPESSGNPDGIPTPAQLQAVLDNIEMDESGLASRRPANALANTFRITRKGFNVFVSNLQVDNLASVQANITEAVEEYFLTAEPFILGLTIPPRTDKISAVMLGGIVAGIVASVNGTFDSVAIFDGPVPVDAYTLGQGEKAKAASVSFV